MIKLLKSLKQKRTSFKSNCNLLTLTFNLIIIELICIRQTQTRGLLDHRVSSMRELTEFDHDHSYPTMISFNNHKHSNQIPDKDNDKLLTFKDKNSLLRNPIKDVNYLFPHCLCTFHQETKRNFLHCNDQNLKQIPDFKFVLEMFNAHIKPTNPSLNLIFSKVDFSGSGVRKIRKNDLKDLQFDFLNPHKPSIYSITNFSFEFYLEHLKRTVLPMYHLDFDQITEIEDEAFEEFMDSNVKLTYELARISKNTNNSDLFKNDLMLKIRFSNSRFNFAPRRRPFAGLKAQEFHIINMTNEHLANSIFDQSVISELYFDFAPNFVGFLDLSNHLPTGKLLHRLIMMRSYKVDTLCSHSLPSFVDQETFYEIIIKKCTNLTAIKAFTFYRYPHLKTLILAQNMLRVIDKNSLRYLSQLEMLDLSNNPISQLEDNTFKDLFSLKRLFLESTNLKQIEMYTLNGLHSLIDLRFSKSERLSHIDPKAFTDSKLTLKELHLKDTQVRLIDAILEDDEEPPYLPDVAIKPANVWLQDLRLNLLNIDSKANNEQLSMEVENSDELLCKILRHMPSQTLVDLQRNQSCNCIVYLLYRAKNFPHYDRWEYKVPFCYRIQIKLDYKRRKSFENIIVREKECQLDKLDEFCFPPHTTTSTTTTSTTTTSTTTTSTTTIAPTTPMIKITQRIKQDVTKIPPSLVISDRRPPTKKLPKLDLAKLGKVIATIICISLLSILLTIAVLRVTNRRNKKKRERIIRQRTNSASSSTQASVNINPSLTNPKRKTIVMPPTVIPSFGSKPPQNKLPQPPRTQPKTSSQLSNPQVISPQLTSSQVITPQVTSSQVISPQVTSSQVISPQVIEQQAISPQIINSEITTVPQVAPQDTITSVIQ